MARNLSAHELLNAAISDNGLNYGEVARRVGYGSHSAVWQFSTGYSKIPLDKAYGLGVAAGMTSDQATNLFLVNLRERAPNLYKTISLVINEEVKKQLAAG